jgi:hypothetical protein
LETHLGAVTVGAAFLILTLYYNATVPLWEPDNEWFHYQYALHLARTGSLPQVGDLPPLPVSSDACTGALTQRQAAQTQYRQPPLYYLVGAPLVWAAPAEPDYTLAVNPHVFTDPSRAGRNRYVQDPTVRSRWHGTPLAVHALRLLSSLIGLAGLAATYLAGLLVFENNRLLGAAVMAINAFIPQYVYSSAVVSNDIMSGALGSWCVLFCLYAFARGPNLLALVGASVAAVLATGSKLTGLILLPLVAVTAIGCLYLAAPRRLRAPVVAGAVLVSMLALGGAAFWLVSVQPDQGRLGASVAQLPDLRELVRVRFGFTAGSDPLFDPFLSLRMSFETFWGLFGTDNIALPRWIAFCLLAVTAAAGIGLVRLLADRARSRRLKAGILAALTVVAIAWAFNTLRNVASWPRGRYYLPLYALICLLLALGLAHLLDRRARPFLPWALAAALLVLSLAVPPMVIGPAFAGPATEIGAALLPGVLPLGATFGDLVELSGYAIEPRVVGGNDPVKVTLAWRVLRATPNNYTLSLAIVDPEMAVRAAVNSLNGGGRFASSLWKPGDVFRETYTLYSISSAGSPPVMGRIKVTLHCWGQEGDPHLRVRNAAGEPSGDAVYLDRLKLVADGSQQTHRIDPTSASVRFGDEILLHSVAMTPTIPVPGSPVTVTAWFQAARAPTADYSLFLHLIDAAGKRVAGADQPLTQGRLPSGLWDPGESVLHTQQLAIPGSLPAGTYTLSIGLYDPSTLVRLPATDMLSGSRLAEDRFTVSRISLP